MAGREGGRTVEGERCGGGSETRTGRAVADKIPVFAKVVINSGVFTTHNKPQSTLSLSLSLS